MCCLPHNDSSACLLAVICSCLPMSRLTDQRRSTRSTRALTNGQVSPTEKLCTKCRSGFLVSSPRFTSLTRFNLLNPSAQQVLSRKGKSRQGSTTDQTPVRSTSGGGARTSSSAGKRHKSSSSNTGARCVVYSFTSVMPDPVASMQICGLC